MVSDHLDNTAVNALIADKHNLAAALMKNDPAMWDEQVKSLKRAGERLSGQRKRMNDTIAADEKVAATLKWFKKYDHPETMLRNIEKEITSDGRSKDYAQWFLNSDEYKTWFEALCHHGDNDVQSQLRRPARILWITGSYGMGKTTLVYVVPACMSHPLIFM